MSDRMTCNEVDELAAAFALGALEADEEDALQAHLASCDQPHREMRNALGAGAVLAESLDPVAPSPGLRDRLMATIERTPQAHRPAISAPPPAERPGWLAWLSPQVARPLAVAAVVALLAIGAWNLSLQSQLGQRDAALRAVASAISDGDLAFRVDGSAGRGYVVETPGEGAALVVADLAELPADRLYELWLIDASGAAVAVGTFAPADRAVAVVPIERDLAGYATFAVTVEAERVAAPSGAPVMIGDLGASQPG
jgi:anti-sigma-K factor RskA